MNPAGESKRLIRIRKDNQRLIGYVCSNLCFGCAWTLIRKVILIENRIKSGLCQRQDIPRPRPSYPRTICISHNKKPNHCNQIF
ncbi:hypothetical protein BpHYR1_051107 [Brachionus plicatilis]|uniref:Uncharacterized protein n=1 Tax=Brachionus plicatilis TaxID=10195 RepID=A0A3M7S298_BRAPC|nr:hypothetical protein BpHYR1_051107 [Brachionus plicatilis]